MNASNRVSRFIVLVLLAAPLCVRGQERPGAAEKVVHIVRTATPPTIDGDLDEAVWQTAARVADLHEIQPTEYAAPSEPTIVYLLYDDKALYIGARLYDRSPDEITARIMRQGERVFGDDWFSVILDPFHDRRSGYRFQTNPNGLRQEALYENVSDEQWDWQGIWYAASRIDDDGWATEIEIPFKTLSFDPADDTWGINFRRSIARRDERMGWVSRNRNTDPSVSGVVTGLMGLEQGVGLDVVPSLSVGRRRDFGPPAAFDTRLEPSLDVFYKITPGLTGSLTVNTDFSATEIDDRQVNLTRFDLFFPEKRDFFLQDADIFEFGGIDQNGRPFFSRTIGLSAAGDMLDLHYGGKVSGRIGRWNIGALSVQQDGVDATGAPTGTTSATVARVSANLLEESSIGFIATQGDPDSRLDNSLAGADFLYRNSRLPGGKLIEVNGWAQRSDTEGVMDRQDAYGIHVGMPNNTGFRGGIRFAHIDENFNPGLGFIDRRGVRQLTYGTQYTARPHDGYLRSVLGGFNVERFEGLDGELQSQLVRYRLAEVQSRLGDKLALQRSTEREVLVEAFEIFRGVSIPPGSYTFDATRVQLDTGEQRKLAAKVSLQSGEFYGGSRREIVTKMVWRPSAHLRTQVAYEYNDIDLPFGSAGSFETRLVELRTDVAFSPTLSWVTRIQYDNVSELMGVNVRLHWIPQAGREGYIVLNHTLDDLDFDNRLRSADAEATVKFNYTFRF